MKNNNPLSLILSIFFAVIFFVPVYWLVQGNPEKLWSLIEYRDLDPFPPFPIQDIRTSAKRVLQKRPIEAWKVLGTQFQSGKYPKKLETASSDRFPLRSLAIQLSYGFDRIMIRLGYSFQDDPAIPADMKGSQIYEMREGTKTLFYYPKRKKDTDFEKINRTKETYKALIQAHPDINFYMFFIEGIDYSSINPLLSYNPSAVNGFYFDYFSQEVPDRLNVEVLRISTFDDHLNYFYRTDHHWNIHGTLRAYELIYQMLARNYPGISPILAHDQIYTFPDIGFHGSMSRFTAYQLQPPDVFEVALVDLPPYQTLDAEGNVIQLGHKNEYLSGQYSKKPFTDHYIEYYGFDRDYHEYVFESGSNRNLLIIGDSYVNSIETLLGSHYHHTYCVDIRNYPDEYFSLSDFLLEHDVDDVLFLGGPPQTIMQSWTISP